MKQRLAIVLLVLAAGPLFFAWLFLSKQAQTAELTLAARSQPLEEVMVSGCVENFGAKAFSLETLLIEEPGKEPYHRVVALDGENRFELTLGKPAAGKYRCAVKTRKSQWGKGVQEGWLTTPYLVVSDERPPRPALVSARDYDFPHLFLWAGSGLAIWLVAVLVSVMPVVQRRPPLQ